MEVAIELVFIQTLLYSSGLGTSDLEIVSQDTISAFPCNWSVITFECTVYGSIADLTVWKGTAFSGCEIILLHNRFKVEGSTGQCNNKDIIGQIIRVENSSYYISQLEVIVKPDPDINNETVIMETIECIHDNGTAAMLIGSMTINVSVVCSNTTLTLKGDLETQDSNILAIIIIPVALVLIFTFLLSIVSLLLYGFRKKIRSTPALVHDISGKVPREKSKRQVISYDAVGNHVEIVKSFDNETMGIYSLSNLTPDDCFAVQKGDNIAKGETLSCNLKYSLVRALRGQVSSKWYLFGLAIGVPKQVLNQLKHNSDEECLVEVLDYWLRHHPGKPTWQEIMEAKNRILSDTA